MLVFYKAQQNHRLKTRYIGKVMIMPLPPQMDFERPRIFRKLIEAHKHLVELKGLSQSIPNQLVLINTLTLQAITIQQQKKLSTMGKPCKLDMKSF